MPGRYVPLYGLWRHCGYLHGCRNRFTEVLYVNEISGLLAIPVNGQRLSALQLFKELGNGAALVIRVRPINIGKPQENGL